MVAIRDVDLVAVGWPRFRSFTDADVFCGSSEFRRHDRNAHRLAKAGDITRIDNPDDRRSRLVKPAPSGDRKAKTISKEVVATNQNIIRGNPSDREAEQLADILMKLSIGLRQMNS